MLFKPNQFKVLLLVPFWCDQLKPCVFAMHGAFGAFVAACGATLQLDAVASTDVAGSTNEIGIPLCLV